MDYSERHIRAFTLYRAKGFSIEGLRDDQISALREDPALAADLDRRAATAPAKKKAADPGSTVVTAAGLAEYAKGTAADTAKFVKTMIEKATAPLRDRIELLEVSDVRKDARIAELEARPVQKHAGTWNPAIEYAPGDMVSYDGSAWTSNWKSKGAVPGKNSAWTCFVQRGKDGRDLR